MLAREANLFPRSKERAHHSRDWQPQHAWDNKSRKTGPLVPRGTPAKPSPGSFQILGCVPASAAWKEAPRLREDEEDQRLPRASARPTVIRPRMGSCTSPPVQSAIFLVKSVGPKFSAPRTHAKAEAAAERGVIARRVSLPPVCPRAPVAGCGAREEGEGPEDRRRRFENPPGRLPGGGGQSSSLLSLVRTPNLWVAVTTCRPVATEAIQSTDATEDLNRRGLCPQ